MTQKAYQFVSDLWKDEEVASLTPLERLVYRSNKLGSDQRITNTGGGNTSSKLQETDPLTKDPVDVLWVKGSGGDLRTSKKENFSSLYQDKLIALQKIYDRYENKGPKSQAEDDMVAMYNHCTFNLNPRACSIDTPLHSFVPYRHVDHTHPNAVIAIAASRNAESLTKEVFGDEVVYTPWLRPGFELGLEMQRICKAHPNAKGILLGQHGLINWADDDRDCYYVSLDLIEKAAQYIEKKYEEKGGDAAAFGGPKHRSLPKEVRRRVVSRLLPWLRGQVSRERRLIGTLQDDDPILRFVNSADADRLAELGTSCPDHFLRTKIKPLYLNLDPTHEERFDEEWEESFLEELKSKLTAELEKYRSDYADYYEQCKRSDSPPMRSPSPTVILIPGVGMIAWGKNKSESRVTAEFYRCAVEVMRGAETIDRYTSLPKQEAFDIEYWQLEEAKLRRMPPEKELDRQVSVVIGAGSGIGHAVVQRLAQEGSHLVCVDIDRQAAEEVAGEMTDRYGHGIGVAGSDLSGCGPAIGLGCDITDRSQVREMLEKVLLAYGGLDHLVLTAGLFYPPDTHGRIPDDKWSQTYQVNVIGPYIVAEEAARIWQEQGLTGSLVIATSANAVVPKTGSVAYDTSKAAANHLVRELAMQLSPLVRVNGVAPATVVKGSRMFPRERVLASLTKYRIPYSEEESTEALREKLAEFYAGRTLTKTPITPTDQAEAFFLLVSRRLEKTTGQILPVDGGLHEAFLR